MYTSPEHYRIQLPSMPWPYGRTLTMRKRGDTTKEDLHEVSLSEPLKYRKAVEKLAYYFRREFGYDFPPYHASSTTDVVFMWIGEDYDWNGRRSVGYGACAFDYEPCSESTANFKACNEDGHWFLMWAWFHPYERRKGHLSRAWSYFQKRFGDFGIQYPISKEMENFLGKHHDITMVEKKFMNTHRRTPIKTQSQAPS